MPSEEMTKLRKTKRDSSVRQGWWKNEAISGAQKNNTV